MQGPLNTLAHCQRKLVAVQTLKYIQINGRIHGTIPTESYQLTKLTELELQRGAFQGTISPMIGKLTDLQHLHVVGNHFVGSLPTEVGFLSSLARFVHSSPTPIYYLTFAF